MSLFLVDCETPFGQTSPIQGPMTECGLVLLDQPPFPERFHWPLGGGIHDLHSWILEKSVGRPVFVSDNPAFDWQWLAAEFARAGLDNPFGHSGRRISDFWAGLHRNFRTTQSWKALRRTPHDHNPVNDALGNAEALWTILEALKHQRPLDSLRWCTCTSTHTCEGHRA